MEDCLKAIYLLGKAGTKTSTKLLANQLGVSPSVITRLFQRLADRSLICYRPNYGCQLTELGSKVAREILRHHGLIELFLFETVGLPEQEASYEADRLEHFLSEPLERALERHLNHPIVGVGGHEIPSKD